MGLLAVVWLLIECCFIRPLLLLLLLLPPLLLLLLLLLPQLLSALVASGCKYRIARLLWHRRIELHLRKPSTLQAHMAM